jgi:tetratricopeptide (TPR) repeat protein
MKIVPLILLLAIAISPASAMDPRQRFDEAVRTGDDAQVDQAMTAWTAAEPQNPEAYVKAANHYFNKARRELIQMSPKPPEKGDFSLKDSESGKIVGSIGPVVSLNPAVASHATDILREATRKFPERLDIWFGLAYIHNELHNFDALYSTFEEAFKYCTGHPTELKWKNGQPLPKDPANFMPEHAQRYIKDYFSRETPEDKERAFRLAKLVAESYPNHPYPLNVIGIYFANKKEWTQAISNLEKAHELDPRDALIMMNLGMIHLDLHENDKARAYYEKVIASDADERIRQMAQKKLAELK